MKFRMKQNIHNDAFDGRPNRSIRHRESGFGLIELVMIIVVIGIVAAMAMRSMTDVLGDFRATETDKEMEMLVHAIAGDPWLTNTAARTDFGYVGDVGALPDSLPQLVTDPGYATWDGPYLAAGYTQDSIGYKLDGWGKAYVYSKAALTVTSSGSGTNIVRKIADAEADLLRNAIWGTVKDLNDSVPGSANAALINIAITIPVGAGNVTTKTYHPDSAGDFMLDSIPIGPHPISVVYTPANDTLLRTLVVLPRHRSGFMGRFNFDTAYFSSSETYDDWLTLVAGSDTVQGTSCNDIAFDIYNNTGATVSVSSIKLTWSSPTAYYSFVKWDNTTVVSSGTNRIASGETATFTTTKTIAHGATVTIDVTGFRSTRSGSSSARNMEGVNMTVEFSDGSTISFTTGDC